ncbi:DUF3558 family protein [Lentzea sp. JNUCC 0626]|uniref:DUF3558 family protein n=1 Tax=Lentzea sp. JNUCC 0626 TaxID=3367513 RepID=UPI003748BD77
MRRLLPLLLLVAGCTATPVATPAPTTTTTTTTETTVITTSPRIDTPKKLPPDPCELLASTDFDTPLVRPPTLRRDLPRTCEFREGTGVASDMVVLVSFGEIYLKPPDAPEMLIEGHSTAIMFTNRAGVNGCGYVVAVNANESFMVLVNLPNANSSQLSQIALGKTQKAFKRLVTT